MTVQDLWYKKDPANPGKKIPSARHKRGQRWRVVNEGTPTRSFDKKADADAWDTSVKADLLKGITPFDFKAGAVKFRMYADKIMAERAYSPRGRETTMSLLKNHVYPVLGDSPIGKVKPSTVRAWWAGMRAKRHHGKLYSASVLESVWGITGSILRQAVRDKVIGEHPMDGFAPDLPDRDKSVRDVWEQRQVDGILAAVPDRYRAVPLMSATCGHRPGESFAVALEDVNRFKGKLSIRHQVNWVDGKAVLVPPKNGSVREVPLPAVTLRALDDHVAAYGTTPVRCTCCDMVWQVIFTDERGRLIRAREFTRDVWRPALAAAGLPVVEENGQHNLRHCFVSRLIFGGASAKDIQAFMGHKKITTTYDVYGHLLKQADDRARSIIDDAFSSDLYLNRTGEAS